VLRTGIGWEHLPQELGFGCGMTAWRRLRAWRQVGVWKKLHELLLAELPADGQLEWERAVADPSHVQAKKGGAKTGPSPVDRARHGSNRRDEIHEGFLALACCLICRRRLEKY
jgi:transposase